MLSSYPVQGKFGKYGGKFIPETLAPAVSELEDAYEKFKNDPSRENSMRVTVVWWTTEAQDGTLWFGTDKGVSSMDPDEPGVFRHFHHNPRDPRSLTNGNVTMILERGREPRQRVAQRYARPDLARLADAFGLPSTALKGTLDSDSSFALGKDLSRASLHLGLKNAAVENWGRMNVLFDATLRERSVTGSLSGSDETTGILIGSNFDVELAGHSLEPVQRCVRRRATHPARAHGVALEDAGELLPQLEVLDGSALSLPAPSLPPLQPLGDALHERMLHPLLYRRISPCKLGRIALAQAKAAS